MTFFFGFILGAAGAVLIGWRGYKRARERLDAATRLHLRARDEIRGHEFELAMAREYYQARTIEAERTIREMGH